MSYHSLLRAEDSFLDKEQTAILAEAEAEAEASGAAVGLAAAAVADLAKVAPAQGCLVPEGLP